MSNCNVTFWTDTDDKKGTGDYKNYTSPTNESDLNEVLWTNESRDDMKNDISWVDTNSQSWVRLYTEPNYAGRTLLVGPDSHLNLKVTKDDQGSDDMNDAVQSFQIFDHKPDVDTVQIAANLRALYPGSQYGTLHELYNSTWYTQDSQYRIYDPEMVLNQDGIDFTAKLDHVQGEHDDHAVLTFSMDLRGGFVDRIQVTYDMADAAQVPEWVIRITDGIIDASADAAKVIADGAEIVVSDGVGVVATVETDEIIDYTAEALTFCIDHLNTVLKAIFTFQDNGGTMYFSAVVSHAIARLVQAYYQELYGPDGNAKMGFNESAFLSALGASKWVSGGKHNEYVEFTQGSHPYRAFKPDNSFLYAHGGAVSSVCLGAVTDDAKDDHLTLQATYAPDGSLFSVAGAIDIFLPREVDGYQAPASGVITRNSGGEMVRIVDGTVTVIHYDSLTAAYSDLMASALTSTASTFDLDISDQQRTLVNASITVLNGMTNAIH